MHGSVAKNTSRVMYACVRAPVAKTSVDVRIYASLLWPLVAFFIYLFDRTTEDDRGSY